MLRAVIMSPVENSINTSQKEARTRRAKYTGELLGNAVAGADLGLPDTHRVCVHCASACAFTAFGWILTTPAEAGRTHANAEIPHNNT